ncbi:hypothetical protein [Acetomicrobium sp. UBA5826]|uniref:hypothetical protein n=1 Tax=Acetomicrobium sp. UBA5826 TaxID=1946039 RepID=UPI00257BC259|nr:hypothetical protein [Acetomicrobium sp. UBA5826]
MKQESTGETWLVSELGRPTFSPGCAVSLEPKGSWILPLVTASETAEERLWNEGVRVS